MDKANYIVAILLILNWLIASWVLMAGRIETGILALVIYALFTVMAVFGVGLLTSKKP